MSQNTTYDIDDIVVAVVVVVDISSSTFSAPYSATVRRPLTLLVVC